MSTEKENQLRRDIEELAKRLGKNLEFYYNLIEAIHIPLDLNPNYKNSYDLEVCMIDKKEFERWQKVKSLIQKFDPNG